MTPADPSVACWANPQLSLIRFLTGWCNLKLLCDFARISHFPPRNDTKSKDFVKKVCNKKNTSFLDYRPNFEIIGFFLAPPAPLYA